MVFWIVVSAHPWATLNLGQRSIFLQWATVNERNLIGQAAEHKRLTGTSILTPSTNFPTNWQDSGNTRTGSGKNTKARGQGESAVRCCFLELSSHLGTHSICGD